MLINEKELAARLREVKTIAVIGAVDKPGRPVDGVAREMIRMGFTIIPVHPTRTEVWGLETFRSVADIPVAVDVVDLFRNGQFCPGHAEEVLEMQTLPTFFWMQSGVFSPEARQILAHTPIQVIEDRCLKVELTRLGVRP
ncbi:MAG: CoA-binding protein [Pseudodesulfovibrio sp.]|uniref:CoA-binding domain protein n=1 Tax=Pseudodesulfovibrio aespoeensis (strain ATCC 700646 / DSM 10631 / Aspo-2) TaxID=643562 RepID=E6VVE8_PSEA9|nr:MULTISPECIES: CoA-binding protein [Pseudodesulfovibrio]MBU4192041.1 CoA-binding protein [Pseudomonadota bacterium]ADU62392.1 CoA-binding domain protein [Pseudodesulfovibrio aespoeensis Aspo-2]MBU4244232.1 CoA-binding protein [Pseudomonadota bacterium]MBU4377579.1 CoA-binding protein [Pseudomonadota bacterium]MBU4473944.1 CoA-binding protein [Pseudomonadota bacterium]